MLTPLPVAQCDRSTITIESGDKTHPKLKIQTYRLNHVFEELKKARSKARAATAVDSDNID